MTVISPRVWESAERRPVQVRVATTFTALAPLSAVPAVKVTLGSKVPFHVTLRVCVPATSQGEMASVSCETVMPVVASGRAVNGSKRCGTHDRREPVGEFSR